MRRPSLGYSDDDCTAHTVKEVNLSPIQLWEKLQLKKVWEVIFGCSQSGALMSITSPRTIEIWSHLETNKTRSQRIRKYKIIKNYSSMYAVSILAQSID